MAPVQRLNDQAGFAIGKIEAVVAVKRGGLQNAGIATKMPLGMLPRSSPGAWRDPLGSKRCRNWSAPYAKSIPEADDLLEAIKEKLKFPILFRTPFRGERGATTSRGVGTYRAIAALYQASRVTQGASITGQGSVLEIGPGFTARNVYYAVKRGIYEYTRIDLPLGVVAQACSLGATLGPTRSGCLARTGRS